MKKILVSLLILLHFKSFSQLKSKLIDGKSKMPIGYVAIYIENGNIIATADENGEFMLPLQKDNENYIVFNALGYEIKKIKFNDVTSEVYLTPTSLLLNEVKVNPSNNSNKIIINGFKKSDDDSSHSSGALSNTFLVARYFPYQESYDDFPFINSISVLTKCKIESAKFNIRIYDAKNGVPSTIINNEIITVTVKKGKRLTLVDLTNLHLTMPKNGIFVAYEWLSIPSNYSTYKSTLIEGKSEQKKTFVSYQPDICLMYESSTKYGWQLSRNNWRKSDYSIDGKNNFPVPAISLTLSD